MQRIWSAILTTPCYAGCAAGISKGHARRRSSCLVERRHRHFYRGLWKGMVFFCIRAHILRSLGTSVKICPVFCMANHPGPVRSSVRDSERLVRPPGDLAGIGLRPMEVCREVERRRSQALKSLAVAACPGDLDAEDASEGARDSDETDNEYIQVSETGPQEASCCSSPQNSCSDDDGIRSQSATGPPSRQTHAARFCVLLRTSLHGTLPRRQIKHDYHGVFCRRTSDWSRWHDF
jgi:hypothetical protein